MFKFYIIILIFSFTFSNTYYTNQMFTGMATEKNKSSFGMSINYANIESYFNQLSLRDTGQLDDEEIQNQRLSIPFKSLNIEYMTKIGLEIGLSIGSDSPDEYIVENLSLAYHFKGKSNKFNGLIGFTKSHIENESDDFSDDNEDIFFEKLSLGFYTGNGFYFRFDHLAFEDGIFFNAVEEEAEFDFITIGKFWKKNIGLFGISYTGKLYENISSNSNQMNDDDDEEKRREIFKQGDITLTLGFKI